MRAGRCLGMSCSAQAENRPPCVFLARGLAPKRGFVTRQVVGVEEKPERFGVLARHLCACEDPMSERFPCHELGGHNVGYSLL